MLRPNKVPATTAAVIAPRNGIPSDDQVQSHISIAHSGPNHMALNSKLKRNEQKWGGGTCQCRRSRRRSGASEFQAEIELASSSARARWSLRLNLSSSG